MPEERAQNLPKPPYEILMHTEWHRVEKVEVVPPYQHVTFHVPTHDPAVVQYGIAHVMTFREASNRCSECGGKMPPATHDRCICKEKT